jgi:hypothetical protein
LLGYLAILGASLAGYAGVGAWIIAVAAIALAALSRAEHGVTYERGRELSLHGVIDSAIVRSLFNGTVASAAAYGFGLVMRII